MPHLFEQLALLTAFVTVAVVALAALAVDAGDELTEPQSRVFRAAITAIAHVASTYGLALVAQDSPFMLVAKAVVPLLR